MILAYAWGRLPIWDGWGINSALIYFVLFPLAVTICGAIILRREARELRSTMVARLNALRIANDSNSKNGPTVSSKWIETVASEIGKMRDGAFGNIVHDPVLGSVLIFITTAATGSGNEVFEFARHVLGIV